MKLLSLSVATIVAAGGLMATAAMSPASEPALLVQAQQRAVTITGVAIGTDGEPAARVPTTLGYLAIAGRSGGAGGGRGGDPDLLSMQQQPQVIDGFTIIARQMTDDSGRFTFRNVRERALQLTIGDKMRTDWHIMTINNDGSKEQIDLGNIQLQPHL